MAGSMISEQLATLAVYSLFYQGLLIDRHRYRLAHLWVAGQHSIVKVEEEPLECSTDGRRDECIVCQELILRHLS
jgi:hypothetical protein